MRLILVMGLFIVPVIEIWVLILLGLGAGLTSVFMICGVTAAGGWWLMRKEDFSLWTLIETEMQNRRLPTEEVLHDFIIWFCGLALIMPGLLTDGLAIVLLVPNVREEGIRWVRERMRRRLEQNIPS